MKLYLIRHAQAVDRRAGTRDLYRPLTDRGRERAGALARELADAGIVRILSSPASRCVQTVEPLATALDLTIEEQPDLWEGSPVVHVLTLLERTIEGDIAVCSHGDIIPAVVEAVAEQGATVAGRGCEKGSIWELVRRQGSWTSARYRGRPDPD